MSLGRRRRRSESAVILTTKTPRFPPVSLFDFLLSVTLGALGVIFHTVGISIWCCIFVDCCLWKPIITERGALLSEFDFHAEKVCAANVIQLSWYYSSFIQTLPVCARPPAPAASQRCTEVQTTDVLQLVWQTGLYEQNELTVVAGLGDNRANQSSVWAFQRNCQRIYHGWACQAITAQFQPNRSHLHLNSEPGVTTMFISERSRKNWTSKIRQRRLTADISVSACEEEEMRKCTN